MKKILIFSPIFFPDIGGPAVQGKYLVELLAAHNYEILVLKYGPIQSSNFPRNVRVVSLNWGGDSNFLRIARWLISPFYALYFLIREKPDIYLANSVFMPGMIFGYVFKFFRIPTVIKFAGDWVSESLGSNDNNAIDYESVYSRSMWTKLLLRVEVFFLERFTKIWVISKYRAENVKSILGNHNGIWEQRNFHNLSNVNVPKITSQTLVFCSASRLVKHKRLDQIISGLSCIKDFDFVFIICGDGPESQNLKDITISHQMQNRIFFPGNIGEELLSQIMQLSDVYISWSAEEGAPNVFIEAMNSGLAIVSAEVGGISEMFDSPDSAVLVNPNKLDDLEVQLIQLLNDRGRVLDLQHRSAVEVQKFLLKENEESFLVLFQSLEPR